MKVQKVFRKSYQNQPFCGRKLQSVNNLAVPAMAWDTPGTLGTPDRLSIIAIAAISLCFGLFASYPAAAQTKAVPAQNATEANLRRDITYLASDELGETRAHAVSSTIRAAGVRLTQRG